MDLKKTSDEIPALLFHNNSRVAKKKKEIHLWSLPSRNGGSSSLIILWLISRGRHFELAAKLRLAKNK